MSSHSDSFAASGSSPTREAFQIPPDFLVENHGSIFLLRPQNERGTAWVNENIGSENGFQPYWPTVVIEHRHIADIVAGIHADGLAVRS